MKKEDYIKILDNLASGLDPITAEKLPNESVLRKREVIRALQFAIDSIYENIKYISPEIIDITLPDDKKHFIEKDNIETLLAKFKEFDINPSITGIIRFLLGSEKTKSEVKSLEGYGVLKGLVYKKKLQKYISKFFEDNIDLIEKYSVEKDDSGWKNIDLPLHPKFNKLKDEYIEKLKERVKNLPVTITNEKLESNPHIVELRKSYPRAYEIYTQEEKDLINKAFLYTNDIKFLSEVFQRNENSIISMFKRYYYSKSKVNDKKSE